ncbi:glycerol-3-phosphate acyltransferase 1, mitochondrial-like isoform X2 [Dendronephthya gigantea]|uniref:glycerol-3-phosphate acyltransferase 1, mitochondrial-like isoform X2 n=1 Tax=Dendronephthya gigantea TaxID=151771 RepID=UPI00106AD4C1|nr:glycerol-3-phosphate acyltransferase 1, mitochondrial-like isoform X2 [Dendronephthya gigantea]
MKASNMNSLEDVFKKWEKKGEERRLNAPVKAGGKQDSSTGRAAWQQRFDASALPRRRPNRKKRQEYDAYDLNSRIMLEHIERKFQLIPPLAVEDNHRTSRPFLGTGCSKCSQKSIRIVFSKEGIKNSPLRNLLDLSVFCRKNFFRTAFSDILYVANLPSVKYKKLKDVQNTVVNSPSVSSTIHRLAASDQNADESPKNAGSSAEKEITNPAMTSKQLKAEAHNIIKAMSGSIKRSLVRIVSWFLFKFFGKVLSSIQIHQGQITMLKEASKRNIPLVYLPLHKSHVDYLLISFVLNWHGLKVPYIAAGDNLTDIPLFSWLMRNMGAFFIRRKLDDQTPQNELYSAIMKEYIAQILISGNNLEIFLEGTRSRSGKNYPPKIGVLSSVISAVNEGRVSDVLIVPVNISYEQILEAGYTGELMGEPKRPESFLRTVKNALRICRSYFGQVRVDFGMPFSLVEMLRSSESSLSWQTFMETTSSCSNQQSIFYETLNGPSTALTKGIANHVIHECVESSTIMGTNMVAFLLLTKFRKGVNLKEFAKAFEMLKKDILMHKRDYGFSGCNEDVILYSVKLLGSDLVSWDSKSCVIKPNILLPAVLELSYYSNQVVSVFLLESIVACSIVTLLEDENLSLSELVYATTTVSRRQLLDTALDLCHVLRKEFIFCNPCVTMEEAIVDAIEKFIAADVLNVCEDISAKSRDKKWANRLAVSTAWSDNSESEEDEIIDQEYRVNASEEAIRKLRFLRNILSPVIESYWFCASSFLSVQPNENESVNSTQASAVARFKAGTLLFGNVWSGRVDHYKKNHSGPKNSFE